ncbi:unnamed protein product, partial [Timema podura]|nr:unnamed protein product [Timema podura]
MLITPFVEDVKQKEVGVYKVGKETTKIFSELQIVLQQQTNRMKIFLSVLAVTLLAALTAGLPLEPEIKFTTSTVAPLDPDHVPSSVCRSMIPSHGASTPQNGV